MNCFVKCRRAPMRERELQAEIAEIGDLMRRLSPGIASPDGVRALGREEIAELVARKTDLETEVAKCAWDHAREGLMLEEHLNSEKNERRKIFCLYYYKYARSMREASKIADVRERTAYRWRVKIEKK